MSDEKDEGDRLVMGVVAGLLVGVVVSVVLDNWGMLGVGIALGAAFGAIPPRRDDRGA